jgi:dolichol-phosphate mannosyltransferase
MGVFGEYLGRVVQELKGRPLFTISQIRQQQSDVVRADDAHGLQASLEKRHRPEKSVSAP